MRYKRFSEVFFRRSSKKRQNSRRKNRGKFFKFKQIIKIEGKFRNLLIYNSLNRTCAFSQNIFIKHFVGFKNRPYLCAH